MSNKCGNTRGYMSDLMVKLGTSGDTVVKTMQRNLDYIDSKKSYQLNSKDVELLSSTKDTLGRYMMYKLTNSPIEKFGYLDSLSTYVSKNGYGNMDTLIQQVQGLRGLDNEGLRILGFETGDVQYLQRAGRFLAVSKFKYLADQGKLAKNLTRNDKGYKERLQETGRLNRSVEGEAKVHLKRIENRDGYYQNELNRLNKLDKGNLSKGTSKKISELKNNITNNKISKKGDTYTAPNEVNNRSFKKDLETLESAFKDEVSRKLDIWKASNQSASAAKAKDKQAEIINDILKKIYGEQATDNVVRVMMQHGSTFDDFSSLLMYRYIVSGSATFKSALRYIEKIAKSYQKARKAIDPTDSIPEKEFSERFWTDYYTADEREQLLFKYMMGKSIELGRKTGVVDANVIHAAFAINQSTTALKYDNNAMVQIILAKYSLGMSPKKAKGLAKKALAGENVPEFERMTRSDVYEILGIDRKFMDRAFRGDNQVLSVAYGIDYIKIRNDYINDVLKGINVEEASVGALKLEIEGGLSDFEKTLKEMIESKPNNVDQGLMRLTSHQFKNGLPVSLYDETGKPRRVIFIDNGVETANSMTDPEVKLYDEVFKLNELNTQVPVTKVNIDRGSVDEIVEQLKKVVEQNKDAVIVMKRYGWGIHPVGRDGDEIEILGKLKIDVRDNQVLVPKAGSIYEVNDAGNLVYRTSSELQLNETLKSVGLELYRREMSGRGKKLREANKTLKDVLKYKYGLQKEDIKLFFAGLSRLDGVKNYGKMQKLVGIQQKLMGRNIEQIDVRHTIDELIEKKDKDFFKQGIYDYLVELHGPTKVNPEDILIDIEDIWNAIYGDPSGLHNIAIKNGFTKNTSIPRDKRFPSFGAALMSDTAFRKYEINLSMPGINEFFELMEQSADKLGPIIGKFVEFENVYKNAKTPDIAQSYIQDSIKLIDEVFGGDIKKRKELIGFIEEFARQNKIFDEKLLDELGIPNGLRFEYKISAIIPAIFNDVGEIASRLKRQGIPLINDVFLPYGNVSKRLGDEKKLTDSVNKQKEKLEKTKDGIVDIIIDAKKEGIKIPKRPKDKSHIEWIDEKIASEVEKLPEGKKSIDGAKTLLGGANDKIIKNLEKRVLELPDEITKEAGKTIRGKFGKKERTEYLNALAKQESKRSIREKATIGQFETVYRKEVALKEAKKQLKSLKSANTANIKKRSKNIVEMAEIRKKIEKLDESIGTAQKSLDDLNEQRAGLSEVGYESVLVNKNLKVKLGLDKQTERFVELSDELAAGILVNNTDTVKYKVKPLVTKINNKQRSYETIMNNYKKKAQEMIAIGKSDEDLKKLWLKTTSELSRLREDMKIRYGALVQHIFSNKTYERGRKTQASIFNITSDPVRIRNREDLDAFDVQRVTTDSSYGSMFDYLRRRIVEAGGYNTTGLTKNKFSIDEIDSVLSKGENIGQSFDKKISNMLTNGYTTVLTKEGAQKVYIDSAIMKLAKTMDDVPEVASMIKKMMPGDRHNLLLAQKARIFSDLMLMNIARRQKAFGQNVNQMIIKGDLDGTVGQFLRKAALISKDGQPLGLARDVIIPGWLNDYMISRGRNGASFEREDVEFMFADFSRKVDSLNTYDKVETFVRKKMPNLSEADIQYISGEFSVYSDMKREVSRMGERLTGRLQEEYEYLTDISKIKTKFYNFTGQKVYFDIDVLQNPNFVGNIQFNGFMSPRTNGKSKITKVENYTDDIHKEKFNGLGNEDLPTNCNF